jgi:hypothetical protein
MSILRKTLIASAAVATLAATVAATSVPASAKMGGFGWGAAGVATGLAVGVAAATAANNPYYGYGPGYGCYIAHQPIYDTYGNYVGVQPVRVCN